MEQALGRRQQALHERLSGNRRGCGRVADQAGPDVAWFGQLAGGNRPQSGQGDQSAGPQHRAYCQRCPSAREPRARGPRQGARLRVRVRHAAAEAAGRDRFDRGTDCDPLRATCGNTCCAVQPCRGAAAQMGITLLGPPLESLQEGEYRRVAGAMARERMDGIIVGDQLENVTYGRLIVSLADIARLPAISASTSKLGDSWLMAPPSRASTVVSLGTSTAS